ncbi:MAG: PH domain-containing protein [Thermomicrobiales bacterium]
MASAVETLAIGQEPPRERLDPRALTLWRTTAAIDGAIFAAVAAGAGGVLYWQDFSPWLVVLPIVVVLAIAIPSAIWAPALRWRHWRYEVRDLEVDLQHGWWTNTRTLVPMVRIQHVDTKRGPLERRFGLASVVLYTAAGSREIPALALDVAVTVRDRIASLAHVQEEL